jgi:hypothetical protein
MERQKSKIGSKPPVPRSIRTFFFGTARAPTQGNNRGSPVPEEKSNANLHVIERRAEKRILVHVPVEVTVVDRKGPPFSERTFIEDVSDFGCRFSTRGPVEKGDTVALKILGRYGNNLPDEKPRLFEIMWVARKENGSTVGARVLQDEKLASVMSPPEDGGRKHDAQ